MASALGPEAQSDVMKGISRLVVSKIRIRKVIFRIG
jgi:hypothetical protein